MTISPHAGEQRRAAGAANRGLAEPLRRDEQHVDGAGARRSSSTSSQSSTLVELIVTARSPARSAAAIWSRISASSGDTTSVRPAARLADRGGRRPVHGRLPPAGGLHHRHAGPIVDEGSYRGALVVAGDRVGARQCDDRAFQRLVGRAQRVHRTSVASRCDTPAVAPAVSHIATTGIGRRAEHSRWRRDALGCSGRSRAGGRGKGAKTCRIAGCGRHHGGSSAPRWPSCWCSRRRPTAATSSPRRPCRRSRRSSA